MRRILAVLILIVLSHSCKEEDVLLYHYIRPELKSVNHSFKPSEIVGGKVDILWVVDNSGSMGEEQASLQQNFKNFIQEFTILKQADWKMGLISTDMEEVPYLGFSGIPGGEFTYLDANPEKRFVDAVGKLGINGTYDEREMDNVKRVFTEYPDFVRKGAHLAVIFLTDEPDHSSMSATDFISFISNTKDSQTDLVEIHGGFTSSDLNICPAGETWSYTGSPFEQMINFFNGSYFDLCSQDFGKELALIGKKIAGKLQYPRVLLKDVPYLCTIKVFFKGEELKYGKIENGGKWFFDQTNNSVVFYNLSFVENDDDRISVEYTIDDGHASPNDDCYNQTNDE